jgi:hypothetical protein
MARKLLTTIALGAALLVGGSALLQGDPHAEAQFRSQKEPIRYITYNQDDMNIIMSDFNNDERPDFFVTWRDSKGSAVAMYMESKKDGTYTPYVFNSTKIGEVRTEAITNLPKEIRDLMNSRK